MLAFGAGAVTPIQMSGCNGMKRLVAAGIVLMIVASGANAASNDAPSERWIVDFNAEVGLGYPALAILGGTLRPHFGLSVSDRGDTSRLYLGLYWELRFGSWMFVDLGVGGAVHDGELKTADPDKKSLGSRVLFRIPIEIGVEITESHRLSILFSHISNAFLASPNEGLDSLGLRYGYRF